MHLDISVKGLFYYGDLSLKIGLFVKEFLSQITLITQILFLIGLQGRCFTQISQITQIWFMIVLKCRYESYVPQKLSPRLKFSRHKWLQVYIEDRKRQGHRFSGKYPSHPLDLSTPWPLALKTSRPQDPLTSHHLAISLFSFFFFDWQNTNPTKKGNNKNICNRR